MIFKPPEIDQLLYGTELITGFGKSVVIADFDFETYSPAGFIWDEKSNTFTKPTGAAKKGLPAIGSAVYSEHPDTEVLSLAYNLKNGKGAKLWIPGMLLPQDLFDHIMDKRLLEAWNVTFESWIWDNVCVPKYLFPMLNRDLLRCAMAKARAYSLPGNLDAAGTILNIKNKKLKDGKRLLNKFSIPRNPTKKNPQNRIYIDEQVQDSDAKLLYEYNMMDIKAEAEISSLIPDLNEFELQFWQCDQQINRRGIQVDRENILNCIKIIEQAHKKYNNRLRTITDNKIQFSSEVQKIRTWLMSQGINTLTLDANDVKELLSREDTSSKAREVLEIRSALSSAAVKKLYALLRQMTSKNRVHDLFIYHSARTGRAAGEGPQPHNFPNSGPTVNICKKCNSKIFVGNFCPCCGYTANDYQEWDFKAVESALETIKLGSLECVEYFWGDAVKTISGCLRGLFISAPNHDLICSDYSAIEAVVLAALAGEEWRLEVFRTHGKIYEMSASKITGLDFAEFDLYKATTGQHHPMRKKVGKVAELASGYQGWIGAWKQFGADEFFTDEEMKKSILAWREASPKIVEMWGGQQKNYKSQLFGLEGNAILAVLNPGTQFIYRHICYVVRDDILYCRLPSGRSIVYHKPRLTRSVRREGTLSLSFEGWNTNPKYGKSGWHRMETYGGKLTENVVQAVARDILAFAIVNLEKSGYPVVIHVHDEIVSEIPENFGSIEEFEKIMSTLPDWAKDWPIKATGGWRGKRYRK